MDRSQQAAQSASKKSFPAPKSSWPALLAAASFIAFPAVVFYAILFRTSLDIPFFDGYDGVLDFLNHLTQVRGFPEKVLYLLAAQHNEYKLVFAESLFWLQFHLLGRTDFNGLSAISNAFVLLLGILLWKMFLPKHRNLSNRLALFIPVSWLLFQLQYFEILNWGGNGLQHIPSTAFAFAAIYLICRKGRLSFCGSAACYLLAVASSGTGFLLLPIGLLLLAAKRSYRRIVAWLLVSAACIAAYSYRYSLMVSQASPDHSVLSALRRLRPIYVLSFMGSAAGTLYRPASFALGACLLAFFLWIAWRGYARRNPAVMGCILFLIITAVGTAGIRSDLGLVQSVSSRYTLFSALLLILAWMAFAEEFLQDRPGSPINNGAYLGAVALAVSFCLFTDAVSLILIKSWDSKLIEGMAAFEHPDSPASTKGPVIPLWEGDRDREALNPRARVILQESIRLGIYRPPRY